MTVAVQAPTHFRSTPACGRSKTPVRKIFGHRRENGSISRAWQR